jgi:hypothetical protein
LLGHVIPDLLAGLLKYIADRLLDAAEGAKGDVDAENIAEQADRPSPPCDRVVAARSWFEYPAPPRRHERGEKTMTERDAVHGDVPGADGAPNAWSQGSHGYGLGRRDWNFTADAIALVAGDG